MYIYIYIYIYTHVWSHTALLGDMATATTRVFAQALIFRSSRHTASSILLLMRLGSPTWAPTYLRRKQLRPSRTYDEP